MKNLLIAALVSCGALAAAGCAATGGQRTAGRGIDDDTVIARVKAHFAEDPSVSAMRIQVEALNGTVQLAGFAASQAEKERAAQIARAVPDVKEVRNNILIRPATN